MSIPKRLRFEVLTRDRYTCRYCGRSAPEVELQVDHVHARMHGGSDEMWNLITACVDCNGGKGGILLERDEQAVVFNSYPHTDCCRDCMRVHRDHRMWPAVEEWATENDGYAALYACELGHEWVTHWSNRLRMTRAALDDATRHVVAAATQEAVL